MRKERILSEYFDRCAAQNLMSNFEAHELPMLARLLKRWRIKPQDKIFEPGCGSGRLTQLLASIVQAPGEILGVDISQHMIARARMRKLKKHVQFRVGSAARISRPAVYFDKILCFNVFPHFLDLPAVFAEMARVLKDGGELWINHLKKRKEINALHARLGSAVGQHKIPDNRTVGLIGSRAGLKVLELRDDQYGYSVKFVKQPVPGRASGQ